MESSILVFGNMMMDMVAPVDDDYLKKYNLTADSIQTATENHLPIYKEISQRRNVTLSPGGSALNTVRMAQKLLQQKHVISFVGAVGDDETGSNLLDLVDKEGIRVLMQKVNDVPTARCASLLTKGGTERTMVTDLGASLKFSHSDWQASQSDIRDTLERTKILYISGYFLKVCPDTVIQTTKILKQTDVTVVLNLNAVWVTTACRKDIVDLVPFVDILIGNSTEILSFAYEVGLVSRQTEEDIFKVIGFLTTWCTERKQTCPVLCSPVIIVTRGELPVLVAEMSQLKEYPVPRLDPDFIVDSTGAGDAFVGGFLASYLRKSSIEKCIKCGIWAASEELKGYGFVLPSDIPSEFQQ